MIYALIIPIFFYLSQLFNHTNCILMFKFATHVKTSLTMLQYTYITSLTSYSLNSAESGKITNLLSGDLNVVDQKIYLLAYITSIPLLVIGITLILFMRIGVPAFFGLAIIALVVPLFSKISGFKGEKFK